MRPGMVASSEGEWSSLVGIVGGLLYGFGGVILTVRCSVTGCVDRARAASPTSLSRIQGISTREMFN
jgi:hypothetical protein